MRHAGEEPGRQAWGPGRWHQGTMRPILPAACSVNQRLPSDPAVILSGCEAELGSGNSVIVPRVVMRPILPVAFSVNQRLPSGPAVMPTGDAVLSGSGNSLIVPAVVMR